MTRCASPTGAVAFCYDFPVASTSSSHSSSSRLPRPRAHSPRPRRRPTPSPMRAFDSDDDDDDEHTQYASHPLPTPTGNQWTRGPSPTHLSPFYPPYPPALALPSSYESERSVLSAKGHVHCAVANKIRKARRSVDEAVPHLSPPPLAYSSSSSGSGSSAPSSPYSLPSDDFSGDEHDAEDDGVFGSPEMDAAELPQAESHHHTDASMAIKRRWAALSLSVRFGVFRAKRKMRDRVLSL
ncbi:hypothetical protein MIND_00388300 [Mycena indigotica]|uniref:Uncharacterized protein n=1 Tax=Mycena indigotica TaxID=2126181 RepID=A0A8H6WF46_9AGAR|nr:uncharacterized protein MIND_00388300 [Mycena indigotica]KAF7310149.1 hypothetical protein MIND_00388300 [Mycena indigotica]